MTSPIPWFNGGAAVKDEYTSGGFMLQESEFFVLQEDGLSKIIYE